MALKMISTINFSVEEHEKKKNMGQKCIKMIFLDSVKLPPYSSVAILVEQSRGWGIISP